MVRPTIAILTALAIGSALHACSSSEPGSAGSAGAAGAPTEDAGNDAMTTDPCLVPPPAAAAFWVSISGSDGGDGSAGKPWATLTHAIQNVPDGALILVKPGRYEQRVRLDRRFDKGIVVRSEEPYRARLRYPGTVVRAFYGAGITLEGFDIAHTGTEVEPVLIHIQDLVEGPDTVERIVLDNNVIHDSRAADLVKINNGARFITVRRSVLYNQADHDEHIDIDSATDVLVEENVLFNDFAGSGRYNDNDTGSYIAIKGGGGEQVTTSQRITIRRNVFANWQGSPGSHFVLLGGWGKPYPEAEDVLIENNLMIGNSPNKIRAAFGVKGAIDAVFRHNTIVGDLPGAAYAMRLVREGESPPNDNIRFYNNIWSDPTRTMYDFSDAPPEDTTSFLLSNNLYFNGGSHMPADDAELVNIWDDALRIVDDPGLPPAAEVALPLWDTESERFVDGSASICQAFERLVDAHCQLSSGSPARGAALLDHSPEDDLIGRARTNAPDIGACQHE